MISWLLKVTSLPLKYTASQPGFLLCRNALHKEIMLRQQICSRQPKAKQGLYHLQNILSSVSTMADPLFYAPGVLSIGKPHTFTLQGITDENRDQAYHWEGDIGCWDLALDLIQKRRLMYKPFPKQCTPFTFELYSPILCTLTWK